MTHGRPWIFTVKVEASMPMPQSRMPASGIKLSPSRSLRLAPRAAMYLLAFFFMGSLGAAAQLPSVATQDQSAMPLTNGENNSPSSASDEGADSSRSRNSSLQSANSVQSVALSSDQIISIL